MNRQQSGFTLIELITVIVILGILSAFALPRFADIEAEARRATVRGLEGSVRSASALAHSLTIAQTASTGTVPATVNMEGQSVAIVNGYPSAVGIVSALQSTQGFTVTTAANSTTFDPVNVTAPASCQVIYNESTGAPNAPVITANVSNCD